MTMPADGGQYVIFPPGRWEPVTLFVPSVPDGVDFREWMYLLCGDDRIWRGSSF
jgi:hypothetical protein